MSSIVQSEKNIYGLVWPSIHLKGSVMQTTMWYIGSLIFAAGVLGGLVNAFISDNGFLLPKSEQTGSGTTIIRPGYLGNCLVGGVAAVISWGLYGPASSVLVAGTAEALTAGASLDKMGLTLAAFVGALLIGVGGAQWLSSEVDKKLLRATATQAAGKQSSGQASQQIATANPADALEFARRMKSA